MLPGSSHNYIVPLWSALNSPASLPLLPLFPLPGMPAPHHWLLTCLNPLYSKLVPLSSFAPLNVAHLSQSHSALWLELVVISILGFSAYALHMVNKMFVGSNSASPFHALPCQPTTPCIESITWYIAGTPCIPTNILKCFRAGKSMNESP